MRELRAAGAALTFLTRMPLSRAVTLTGGDVARATLWFPLVGAGVGAVTGVIAAGLARGVPATLAAAVAVAGGVVLTGALHLDALADTADATGGDSRERALEIMRDHAIGSFGAAAIALDLIVRVLAVAALDARWHVVAVLAAAGAVSRGSSVGVAAALPYARSGSGLGAAVVSGSRARAAVAAAVATVLAVVLVGWTGVAIAGTAAAMVAASVLVYRRWLGGVTGDTLGATSEATEVLALVVAAALA